MMATEWSYENKSEFFQMKYSNEILLEIFYKKSYNDYSFYV